MSRYAALLFREDVFDDELDRFVSKMRQREGADIFRVVPQDQHDDYSRAIVRILQTNPSVRVIDHDAATFEDVKGSRFRMGLVERLPN